MRLFCSEDQVNFRGFMRTLAHFRPIEDNEKNKDPAVSEPLNSRTNKLLCESTPLTLHRRSHYTAPLGHRLVPEPLAHWFLNL